MIQELLDVKPTDSFSEMCARMGAFLGLEEKIPENAMRRAIDDTDFANDLITCRNAPGFLEVLLNDPKNEAYAAEASADDKISNANLIKNASKAFLRWGKAGFSVVDEKTLEARENACLACKNLQKPEKTLQKMVTSKAKEQLGKRAADCVCKLCGCSISKKIRLPSESCPDQHPDHKKLNRWGEVYQNTGGLGEVKL